MRTIKEIIESAKQEISENMGIKINIKFEIDFENREKIVAQTLLIVATESNIIQPLILGKLRDTDIVRARYVAMFLLRNYYGLSLPEIGLQFNKDHTTVIHACKQANDYIDTKYEPFCNLLNKCLQKIEDEKNKN